MGRRGPAPTPTPILEARGSTLVDERGVIVVGDTRYKAAIYLGMDT
jgi:ParB-like chromosome segregation protein Spo0J